MTSRDRLPMSKMFAVVVATSILLTHATTAVSAFSPPSLKNTAAAASAVANTQTTKSRQLIHRSSTSLFPPKASWDIKHDLQTITRTTIVAKMTNDDKEAISNDEIPPPPATSSSISNKDETSLTSTNGDSTTSLATTNGDSAVNGSANSNSNKKVSNSNNSTDKSGMITLLLLLPTLLFKFTIVLLVKFATDVVVYPLLYSYRWARLGKKKLLRSVNRLFGRKGGDDDVVNGSNVNGSSGLNGNSSNASLSVNGSGLNGDGSGGGNTIKANGDSSK